MRKLAIVAALASTVLATPAVARDGSWYAGIEGGVMILEDMEFDYDDGVADVDNGVEIQHNHGYDIDLIGGYDLACSGWKVNLVTRAPPLTMPLSMRASQTALTWLAATILKQTAVPRRFLDAERAAGFR